MSNVKTGYPSIDKTHKKNEKFFEKYPFIPNISISNAFKLMSFPYRKDNAIDCLSLNMTYQELIDNAAILAKGFKELGVKSNDIITVAMPNFSQAVVTFFAANNIGASVAYLDSFATEKEIKDYLNLFESPIYINFDKDKNYNESIKKDTKVKQIITLDNDDLNKKNFNTDDLNNIGYSDFLSYNLMESIANCYKGIVNTLYNGNQNSLISFTSGTTGNPKEVVLTNKNILAASIYLKNSSHVDNTRGEKCLVCVPFKYPYGSCTSMLMSLLCGREAILAPELSAKNISYFLEKKPNIIFGSPALLELIKRNVLDNQDLSSIHTYISGGDFLASSQIDSGIEFFKEHGANVVMNNGSGNAETVSCGTNPVGVKVKKETVGKVLTGSDVVIINPETGKEVKYGEEGIELISGKHVFKEYYKNPELTKQAKVKFKGKTYFNTETRGKLDEEGYFTLTGREARYYIISTLDKVYCDHVQNIMSYIDVIDSVAVVKKPDAENLWTSKAYIVLKDGIQETEEMKKYILEKCNTVVEQSSGKQLRKYEIPTEIEFIKELPRTKADKTDYALLEKYAIEEQIEEKFVRERH